MRLLPILLYFYVIWGSHPAIGKADTESPFFKNLSEQIKRNPGFVADICVKRLEFERKNFKPASMAFVSSLIDFCRRESLLKLNNPRLLSNLIKPFKIVENCLSETCLNFYRKQISLNRRLGSQSSVQKLGHSMITFIDGLNFKGANQENILKLPREFALFLSLNGFIEESRLIYRKIGKSLKGPNADIRLIENQMDIARTYLITMRVKEATQKIEKLLSKISKLKSSDETLKLVVLMEYATALRQSNRFEKASHVLDNVKDKFNIIKLDSLKGWYFLERAHHFFEKKQLEKAFKNLEIARKFYKGGEPLFLWYVDLREASFKIQHGDTKAGKQALKSFESTLKGDPFPPVVVYYYLYENALWAFRIGNTKVLQSILSEIEILFKNSTQLNRFKILIKPLLVALKFKMNPSSQLKAELVSAVKEKNALLQDFYKSTVVDRLIKKDVLPTLDEIIM